MLSRRTQLCQLLFRQRTSGISDYMPPLSCKQQCRNRSHYRCASQLTIAQTLVTCNTVITEYPMTPCLKCVTTQNNIRSMALLPGLPGWAGTRKAKPIWILLKEEISEWQWHRLGHMQVCTLLQADNHANTPPLSFSAGQMHFLPP